MLKAMGIEADKIEEIITAHSETVNGLKDQMDELKENSRELERLKAENKRLKENEPQDDGYKAKYEAEHEEFEQYKTQIADQNSKKAKETAYRKLLEKIGLHSRLIDTITAADDVTKIELDENGKIKGADDLEKEVREDWKEFIPVSGKRGAGHENPPEGEDSVTAEEFAKMGYAERIALKNKDPELYAKLRKRI